MTSLSVSRPRVAALERRVEGQCSAGDTVRIANEHSLLRFLENIEADCGYRPQFAIAVGLSVTAALTLLEPRAINGIAWAPRSLTLTWPELPQSRDALEVEATILSSSANEAQVEFRVRAGSGREVLVGQMRVVPTRNGRYAPSPEVADALPPSAPNRPIASSGAATQGATTASAHGAEPATPPLLVLRPPVIERSDVGVRVRFFPDLIRLLCNPVAANGEPLGRRVHPIGGYAISAALVAASELAKQLSAASTPRAAGMKFVVRDAWDQDDEIVAVALRRENGDRDGKGEHEISVRILRGDEQLVATASISFAKDSHHDPGSSTRSEAKVRGDSTSPATAAATIEIVDLERLIALLNPAYFDVAHCGSRFGARTHGVHFSRSDRRLYVTYADGFVFYSDDSFATLKEVAEVNYIGGALSRAGTRFIDAVTDTLRGTVLLVGRDMQAGDSAGVVWRKEKGAVEFVREIAITPAWQSSRSGNAASGFFGRDAGEMVVLAIYATPAHLYFSVDDGKSWRRRDLDQAFLEHVHQVYLPRATNLQRVSRLWVSGGDDPSGARSGVVTFDALGADGSLQGFQWAMHERPGFRLVGLAGDGKHVYVGNESVAGGVIRILDNQQTIAVQDYEYAMGKSRHDYHQFRSMVATMDGIFISGTDSYGYTGDTIRADSGGYLYLSNDGGASCREIAIGAKWITAIAYDERAFWVAAGMNREEGADASEHRLSLLRVPKPSPLADLGAAYCAKPVLVDSSAFYKMAGYADHPQARLAPGEHSLRVDMHPFGTISVDVHTFGPAQLAIEATPFLNWHPDETPWAEVATLTFDAAGRQSPSLAAPASHNRYFRLRNRGDCDALLRFAAFVGRR